MSNSSPHNDRLTNKSAAAAIAALFDIFDAANAFINHVESAPALAAALTTAAENLTSATANTARDHAVEATIVTLTDSAAAIYFFIDANEAASVFSDADEVGIAFTDAGVALYTAFVNASNAATTATDTVVDILNSILSTTARIER